MFKWLPIIRLSRGDKSSTNPFRIKVSRHYHAGAEALRQLYLYQRRYVAGYWIVPPMFGAAAIFFALGMLTAMFICLGIAAIGWRVGHCHNDKFNQFNAAAIKAVAAATNYDTTLDVEISKQAYGLWLKYSPLIDIDPHGIKEIERTLVDYHLEPAFEFVMNIQDVFDRIDEKARVWDLD